jgi:hypothetical protein
MKTRMGSEAAEQALLQGCCSHGLGQHKVAAVAAAGRAALLIAVCGSSSSDVTRIHQAAMRFCASTEGAHAACHTVSFFEAGNRNTQLQNRLAALLASRAWGQMAEPTGMIGLVRCGGAAGSALLAALFWAAAADCVCCLPSVSGHCAGVYSRDSELLLLSSDACSICTAVHWCTLLCSSPAQSCVVCT